MSGRKLHLIFFILLFPQLLFAQAAAPPAVPLNGEESAAPADQGVWDLMLSPQTITQLAAENWKGNEGQITQAIKSMNPEIESINIVPQDNKLSLTITRVTPSGREEITFQTDPGSLGDAGKSKPIDEFDMNSWLQTQGQQQIKNITSVSNGSQEVWKISVASQTGWPEQKAGKDKPADVLPKDGAPAQKEKSGFSKWMDDVMSSSSLLKDYRDGGTVMHFILFCSIAGVYIIIDRFLELRRKTLMPPSFLEGVLTRLPDKKLGAEEHEKALQNLQNFCEEHDRPIAHILKAGLFVYDEENILGLETAVTQATQHEAIGMSKGMSLLEVYANMSPLLGLLGTVTGMISAFNAIAVAGTGKPEIVAAGIAEALITTAFGLFVGIPLLVLFYYLQGKIDGLLVEMQEFSMDVIERLIRAEETKRGEC
ncbi:MAG: MotA/TolQ/ExbB proton channel family protein [Candidatus Schekmanbacteria bacterium]|nr:MotA/TolQ/ExbB proton channel family protein [Candidatus Schekmanbacteria bacterium]